MCCAVDTRNKSLLTDAIDVSCSAPHIHAIATLDNIHAGTLSSETSWLAIYIHAHCKILGDRRIVNDFGTFGPFDMKSLVNITRLLSNINRICVC